MEENELKKMEISLDYAEEAEKDASDSVIKAMNDLENAKFYFSVKVEERELVKASVKSSILKASNSWLTDREKEVIARCC